MDSLYSGAPTLPSRAAQGITGAMSADALQTRAPRAALQGWVPDAPHVPGGLKTVAAGHSAWTGGGSRRGRWLSFPLSQPRSGRRWVRGPPCTGGSRWARGWAPLSLRPVRVGAQRCTARQRDATSPRLRQGVQRREGLGAGELVPRAAGAPASLSAAAWMEPCLGPPVGIQQAVLRHVDGVTAPQVETSRFVVSLSLSVLSTFLPMLPGSLACGWDSDHLTWKEAPWERKWRGSIAGGRGVATSPALTRWCRLAGGERAETRAEGVPLPSTAGAGSLRDSFN